MALTSTDIANWLTIGAIIGGSVGCVIHLVERKFKFGSNQLPLLPPETQAEPTQKGTTTMTDLVNDPGAQAIQTAGGAAGSAQLAAAVATVAAHPTVQQVVNQVYSDPTVAPENAASVAAGILNGIAQAEPAILAVSRASPVTSIWVTLGLGVMSSIIAAFYPHPALVNK